MHFSRLMKIRKREWGKFYILAWQVSGVAKCLAWQVFCFAVFAYKLSLT
jgi:hypothetical protein